MSITFKALLEVVEPVCSIRKPVILRSRHGQGKSAMVYQLAQQFNLPVVERRISQLSDGDLYGLPKLSDGKTEWLPPDWLKTACDEPVVLFLDELDRGTQEVRQGFFELADSRKIAGHFLHPDTLVFAAVNGGEHSSQYQVGEMDPAELDRWTVFDLEPSVEDWLNWAKDKVNPIIWDFVNQDQNQLEHKGDFEPNKVYPSRRSWHRFSEVLDSPSAKGVLDPGRPNARLYNLACAFLGLESAIAFSDFVKNYARIVTIEDILDKGDFDLLKNWNIAEYTAFIDKASAAKTWDKQLTDEQIQNLRTFFFMSPAEAAMKFFQDLGDGDIQNMIKFNKDPNVAQRIVSFWNGQQNQQNNQGAPATTTATAQPAQNTTAQPVKRPRGRPRKNP